MPVTLDGVSFHRIEAAGSTSSGIEFRTISCAPGSVTPPHAHDRPMVCLVLEGSSEQRAGRVERRRVAGSTYFYPSGEEHQERFGREGGRIFALDLPSAGLRLPRTSIELRGAAALLARRLRQSAGGADDIAGLHIETAALALVARLAGESAGDGRWVSVARDYLHEHFRQRVTLGAVAAAAGVHPVHLSRAFPMRFGMTLGDYVRALRVDYVARELMVSSRPIAAIAFDAGFCSQSHLTHHFSALMGVPPASYRRTLRG